MESSDVIEEVAEGTQEIQCVGSDNKVSFPIYGENVLVKASQLQSIESTDASNKIKFSQISKFDWEEKYYLGNLVSCNSTYMAYVLIIKSTSDCHVRVINHHTSDRVLLRGFKKKISDIGFESFKSNRLACVDTEGTVYLYDIFENDSTVKSSLILQVNRTNEEEKRETSHRIIWAPSLLVPIDDHEPMVALSYGSKAEVFNIIKLLQNQDSVVLDRSDIKEGIITVSNGHKSDITSLALSPDTKVLATCSNDGTVKFWSLNFDEPLSEPICLHEWEPHNKEPVTSLFFCDNLLMGDDDAPFWRYLITGTANNSVLKIWCAVKWQCVQTITFQPYEDDKTGMVSQPCMKAMIDISAKFFVLTDVYRQVLYILKLHEDNEKDRLSFVAINEFILKEPLLSFAICAAKDKKNRRSSNDEADTDLMSNGNDFEGHENGTDKKENGEKLGGEKSMSSLVTLFAIHKKALQKLSIKFKISRLSEFSSPSISSSSVGDITSLHDALSDITDISESATMHHRNTVTYSLSDDEDEPSTAHLHMDNLNNTSSITPISTSTSTSPRNDGDNTLVGINSSDSMLAQQSLSSIVSESLVSSLDSSSFKVSSLDTSDQMMNGISDEKESRSVPEELKPALAEIPEVIPSVLERIDPNIVKNEIQQPAISTMESSLRELINIVKHQQTTINNQQEELHEIKDMLKVLTSRPSTDSSSTRVSNEQLESDRDDLKVYMQLLQKSAQSQFSKANKEFNKLCNQKIEQFTQDLHVHAQAKDERNMQTLSNIVSNTIAIKLEKTIKTEMKQTILNGLEKTMNKHLEHTSSLIAQKLSVWERTLREETQELIKSKPLVEAIGFSAASVLEGTIPNAYRESFKNILLPGFEKASMAMFMQINQTFQQGTKQYLERLESYLDTKRVKQHENEEPLISNLQDLVQSFQGTADRLTSGVETNLEALMQKQLGDATDRMQNNFIKNIESRTIPVLSQSISKCVGEAFDTWKSKMDVITQGASISHTTEESFEWKKSRVVQLIESFDYLNAFEVALTASSLQLVMYACKQVDPTELFQQSNGQLSQPIILSLIQQLSVNLTEDTETKKRYLEESIMALDLSNDITREHMPSVLQSLNEQLSGTIENLIQVEPTSKRIKPLRMLLMASKSLLHDD